MHSACMNYQRAREATRAGELPEQNLVAQSPSFASRLRLLGINPWPLRPPSSSPEKLPQSLLYIEHGGGRFMVKDKSFILFCQVEAASEVTPRFQTLHAMPVSVG